MPLPSPSLKLFLFDYFYWIYFISIFLCVFSGPGIKLIFDFKLSSWVRARGAVFSVLELPKIDPWFLLPLAWFWDSRSIDLIFSFNSLAYLKSAKPSVANRPELDDCVLNWLLLFELIGRFFLAKLFIRPFYAPSVRLTCAKLAVCFCSPPEKSVYVFVVMLVYGCIWLCSMFSSAKSRHIDWTDSSTSFLSVLSKAF